MENKYIHKITGDKFIIEMKSNRFTHDLIKFISTDFPFSSLVSYNTVEFNLEQVRMIDSSSIGYLFELHNKLKSAAQARDLIISVGNNRELKDLLHRFQVDLLLNVR